MVMEVIMVLFVLIGILYFCNEYKSPVEAAKEELDSLKNSYPTTDIYTITFGNERRSCWLIRRNESRKF